MARQKIDIRKFRHAIAILKKKGLVNVANAGRVKPTPALKSAITRYDDVLSGKIEPIKLPKKKLAQYKEAGYQITKGRVLVPKSAVETVKLNRRQEIEISHPTGMKRIKQIVPYRNLKQWIEGMKVKAAEINLLKSKNDYWAYKFYGYNSYRVYEDIELLIDDLIEGSVSGLNFNHIYNQETRKQQHEVYQNLEIVRTPKGSWKPTPKAKRQRSPRKKRK